MLLNKSNPSVVRNRQEGFTLVEVVIAMVIMLIGLLALLNTAATIIQNNLGNVIRDEAVNVAAAALSDIKNTQFSAIASAPPVTVPRYFRGIETDFSVSSTVNPVGTGDTKTVQVLVTWTYKGSQYQHSITTVINSP